MGSGATVGGGVKLAIGGGGAGVRDGTGVDVAGEVATRAAVPMAAPEVGLSDWVTAGLVVAGGGGSEVGLSWPAMIAGVVRTGGSVDLPYGNGSSGPEVIASASSISTATPPIAQAHTGSSFGTSRRRTRPAAGDAGAEGAGRPGAGRVVWPASP